MNSTFYANILLQPQDVTVQPRIADLPLRIGRALGVQAGLELRAAAILQATEVAAAPGQSGDRAVDELIHEELHVGATLRHAVGHTRQAEHGREAAAQVNAVAQRARDDLEAADRLARAAV